MEPQGSSSAAGDSSDGGRRLEQYSTSEGTVHTYLAGRSADGASDSGPDSAGPKRRRDAAEEAESGPPQLHPDVELCPPQREVLEKVVSSLNTAHTSVVVTNPLLRDNPIVYVTKPWEHMCGFTYSEAVGRNPRVTQGEHSDPAVMQLMSGALREQRACKVMMLNYRGGLNARPFWNLLSISPVMHSGKLMLYLANLQDYTYHMAKLMTLPPTQFCRAAEHHQRARSLPFPPIQSQTYARPAVFEADDECALSLSESAAAAQGAAARRGPPQIMMKRLGWSQLPLEPEHLTDRVVDALGAMDARWERVDAADEDDDVFVVNANVNGVACRILVTRDPDADGCYRISCTRLGGDTFAYHEAFRQLRTLLGEAARSGAPMDGGDSVRAAETVECPLPKRRRADDDEMAAAGSGGAGGSSSRIVEVATATGEEGAADGGG